MQRLDDPLEKLAKMGFELDLLKQSNSIQATLHNLQAGHQFEFLMPLTQSYTALPPFLQSPS